MKERDDDFLNFFLLNMCAPKIIALLVSIYFMFIREILTEGFVFEREFQQLQFCGSCSYNEVLLFCN